MTDTENSGGTEAARPRGLKPFVKGESGNPGGRPRGFGALIRSETRDGAELVFFMLDVARGKRRAKLETRILAVSWLADRGFGRPIQTTELTGKDGEAILIREIVVERHVVALLDSVEQTLPPPGLAAPASFDRPDPVTSPANLVVDFGAPRRGPGADP